MAAYRDSLARGSQIGFGSDGVLIVAEIVGHISQNLDQGHTDVGLVSLLPGGYSERHAVQDQLPEALVILGEVVDTWLSRRGTRTDSLCKAIEAGRACGFEREIHFAKAGVKTGQGSDVPVLNDLDQTQCVS